MPRPTLPVQVLGADGLYKRYEVTHADGSLTDPDAIYFVLRLDAGGSDVEHIEACQDAALEFCRKIANKRLAAELKELVRYYRGMLAARQVAEDL
jgi:hypothetical protein